jgi:hypothetical protein
MLLLVPSGCQEGVSATPPRRFEVHAVQTSAGPMLVRFDTATGELTQSPLADGRDWQPLGSLPALAGGAPRPGRFSLDYVQAPSIPLTFIRTDTETGAVWRLGHPRDRDWTALRSGGPAAQADSPTPPPAAREARERRSPPPAPAVSPERPAPAPAGDVEPLAEAAESGELPTEMRTWAIEQLGTTPGERSIVSLLDLLDDEDPTVVRTAARALARHDDPRVRPALEALTQHGSTEVRRVAESELARLP